MSVHKRRLEDRDHRHMDGTDFQAFKMTLNVSGEKRKSFEVVTALPVAACFMVSDFGVGVNSSLIGQSLVICSWV